MQAGFLVICFKLSDFIAEMYVLGLECGVSKCLQPSYTFVMIPIIPN